MRKNLNTAGLPIGGPSLLMAFVLLCLTTFAVISYMAALRDYKLSEKTASNITLYYEADAKAEEILAELSTQVKQNQDGLEEIWSNYDMTIAKENEKRIVSYLVPIKKEMVLKVVVEFSNEMDSYNILTWKQVNTHAIEYNPTFLDFPAF